MLGDVRPPVERYTCRRPLVIVAPVLQSPGAGGAS